MDELTRKFGIRLKQLRTESHLTQEQLALMIGVSKKYVSNIENGRGNPTLTTIGKFARGLDVTASELLDGVDSKTS